MELKTIVHYITSPEIQEQLFLVKIVFFVFTGFFAGAFLILISKTEWLREIILRDVFEFFSQRARLPGRLARYLERIKKRLEIGTEAELKLALIEADSLCEEVLENMGYQGENLEERLKGVPPTLISNLEKLLSAHQIRNNVVHDPDYKLTIEKAKEALEIYEKALRDIEVL